MRKVSIGDFVETIHNVNGILTDVKNTYYGTIVFITTSGGETFYCPIEDLKNCKYGGLTMTKEYVERETTQNEIKKLCDKYNLAYGEQYGGFAEKIANITNTIPAADVQEVKHGKWKYDPNAVDFGIGGWICSCCSTRNNNLFAGTNYCPNCGAKMDKE